MALERKVLLFFILMNACFIDCKMMKQFSASMFVEKYSGTKIIQCTERQPFDFTIFPLYQELNSIYFPAKGFFKPVSILQVPNGTAFFSRHNYSGLCYLFVNDCFIKEMQVKHFNWFGGDEFYFENEPSSMRKINGRVAVLPHHFPGIYGHWIFDILGQLAMLEINKVEYDYLCVPYDAKFMKETLEIWGIDSSKIIPLVQGDAIEADEIIVCTSVTQPEVLVGPNANYNMDFVLKYISEKLLDGIKVKKPSTVFSDKVFISRKIAGSRVIPNEDEIFTLFEAYGFKRYELTELSIVQQIELFHNASAIVSFVGSGSTNIIFCRPGAHYVEIIQNTVDATFFYVSDIFKLKYSCINNSTFHDLTGGHQLTPAKEFPISLIESFLIRVKDL